VISVVPLHAELVVGDPKFTQFPGMVSTSVGAAGATNTEYTKDIPDS
jgi:hypothetical protein